MIRTKACLEKSPSQIKQGDDFSNSENLLSIRWKKKDTVLFRAMSIILDSRLKTDTHLLGSLQLKECGNSVLLLSKNALFPWFILVPATQEIEFHKLNPEQQLHTQQHINAIAQFIEEQFPTDKINIASIGNIVSQLHVHIIGRSKEDICWPGVVWGTPHFKNYEAHEVDAIKAALASNLKGIFYATNDETSFGLNCAD